MNIDSALALDAGAANAVLTTSTVAQCITDGFGLVSDAGYLAKCQVDTPPAIVDLVWMIIRRYRSEVGKVLDAGAGDGRFSIGGTYRQYVGYELDCRRIPVDSLPANAQIMRSDAFALPEPFDFDLAIGNPPYVRHHDLGDEWRAHISDWIHARTGVRPSGWSNAYLYFIWLGLIATVQDGLVVYLVPFDWVSRPAAKSLRDYIASNGWKLDIFRFDDEPFETVLTTACIVVIDKRSANGTMTYYRISAEHQIAQISSPTLTEYQPLAYKCAMAAVFARRGLSPGDQKVFLLKEADRVRHRLRIGRDVVPAVSTLRRIDCSEPVLTNAFFEKHFVASGERCWLINTANRPSIVLRRYLQQNAHICQNNSTCAKRLDWWRFTMPPPPQILYSSGFRGQTLKALRNELNAIAVGSVCGIYTATPELADIVFSRVRNFDFGAQVVALSKGFTKVEVNQMNGFVQSLFRDE